ncbi:MAG: hypothetical protein KC731_06140, partial [Myxococcales bacterium]|nr:hypothetical protein [Myxococcales bacterium]
DNMGIVPSALIDFGFRPSIGVYFFSDDLPVEGLGFRSHLSFGGVGFYRATGAVRYELDEDTVDTHYKQIQLKGIYSRRPDQLFWGIGPEAPASHRSAYTAQYIEAIASYAGGFWRSSTLDAWLGVRDAQFHASGCCDEDDRNVGFSVLNGYFPPPPLLVDGYLAMRGGLDVSLDTRERLGLYGDEEGSDHVEPSGTGIKFDPRVEIGVGLRKAPAFGDPTSNVRPTWVRYGGTLGGFVDIYNQRIIGLQVIADFVDPMKGDQPVPFTELVSLGGNRPMRGFLQNRLLGRSSAVAQLSYRWPIWVWLDGALHYAVGNVFGERLEGFDPRRLRQSFDFGFAASGARDHTFELLFGFGTETFDQGGDVESFRFVFGSTAGF